nr:oligosaccharide flippase family protein [Clostridium amylolyticum]
MRNVIFKILLSLFNIIIPVIIGPYALSVLGDTLMGRYYFGDTVYNYFFVFASFGIYQYGLREVSRVREDKKKLSKLFTSLFIIGCIANVIAIIAYLIFSYTMYAGTDKFPVLMIFTINIFANVFYIEWVNEALENYNFITVKTILVRLTYIILLVTTIKASGNFYQYVFLSSLYVFFNNVISFLYIKRFIKFDIKEIEIKRHIKYLLMGVLLANANVLYTQVDRFMLGHFIDEPSLLRYTSSQLICTMINSVILAVIYVTIPRLSHHLGKKDELMYESLLNRVVKVYFAFLFPAALGIFVLANEILWLYGKEKLSGAIPILQVFAFYIITGGIESILTNQVIYVKRKERILVKYIFVCGLINVTLNIILLLLGKFTPRNAILTTALSNSILIIIEYYYVRHTLKVNLNLFSIDKMKYFLISLVFIPITSIIKHFIHGTVKISIATIFVNSLVYFTILLVIKDEVLMMFMEKFKTKVKR